MIQIIKSGERHHSDFGWLSTYWHFSFDSYHDPKNMQWGALRVFNDDVVQPGKGFDRHPHRDMEIVTCVLEGALEHRDTLGNTGVIRPGEVQVMSAGSGIAHAEYNHSQDDPLHLLQLWILPRTRGRKPRWEQRQFTADQRAGRLLPVVSSGTLPDTLTIDQDAAIYLSTLRAGQRVEHKSDPARKAYAFVTSGAVTVNDQPLAAGDQARISGEASVRIAASHDAELILLDLPA